MEFLLGDWRFGTDPAENRRCNVPYFCGCQSCRNFLQAVETLRRETWDFFRHLGLDIRCPTEIMGQSPPEADGKIPYRVWYDFPGELRQVPADKAPYPAAPGLKVTFCPGEERRMAPMAGDVHMDAFLRLPFVLDEPRED